MQVLIVDQDNVELNDKVIDGEGCWDFWPKKKIQNNEAGCYVTRKKVRYYIGEDMIRPIFLTRTIPEGVLNETKERKLARRLYKVYFV